MINSVIMRQTRQQMREKKKAVNKDSSRYPLNEKDTISYRNSNSTIRNVRTSPNLKLSVRRRMYHSPLQELLLNSVYIYSYVLKIPLHITVFYKEVKIRFLLEYNYWWEDEEMNTFLSLLSDIFNNKYPESLINPQVVFGYLFLK